MEKLFNTVSRKEITFVSSRCGSSIYSNLYSRILRKYSGFFSKKLTTERCMEFVQIDPFCC